MPFESPYKPLDIPNVSVWDFLFQRKNRKFPDDRTIYQDADTGRSYTYAEVRAAAITFGSGLKSLWDWQKGDVLAVFAPNSIDFPVITWGTLWAGGVISPANPAYTVDELAFQLKDTNARALITHMSCLSTAIAAAKKVGLPQEQIILLGDERHPDAKYKHFTSIRNISKASVYGKSRINPNKDLAFLVYSSGTTGTPKGVMLTHRNIVTNTLQIQAGEEGNLSWNGNADGKGDRMLAFLPFFHIYGLTCLIHNSMYGGYHLFVMSKFDLEKWCSHIQNYRITFSYIVPPVVLQLAKHPIVDKYNLTSLRMLSCGAAPLTHELVNAVYARIGTGIKQGYGLSECSPTTHTLSWKDWNTHTGSVGKLLPSQEMKYMTPSEEGVEPKEVPLGEVGEIYIRGPNVFPGYLGNPRATAECLSEDGWFRTGDVGYQDKDGNLYITDRVKELIKYKGFQVAPAELEGLLTDHPDVDDVAVIGIQDDRLATEVPRAYIVAKTNSRRTPEDAEKIVQWLSSKVAPHKRLRGGVRFLDQIPKSASGKILRRVIKEMAKKEDGSVKAKL
ncbi:hypothetical protein FQN57_004684 [Myotisia sp. PD_48]|nr:hypothetical protein FQN57_004684 [Myotisia sp. PD_48]